MTTTDAPGQTRSGLPAAALTAAIFGEVLFAAWTTSYGSSALPQRDALALSMMAHIDHAPTAVRQALDLDNWLFGPRSLPRDEMFSALDGAISGVLGESQATPVLVFDLDGPARAWIADVLAEIQTA